jgi:hypothetical protein
MPALVAGIHDFTVARRGQDVDGRNNKSGHDVERDVVRSDREML